MKEIDIEQFENALNAEYSRITIKEIIFFFCIMFKID